MFKTFLIALNREVAYQRDVARARISQDMSRRDWFRSPFLWNHPLPVELQRVYDNGVWVGDAQ